MSPHKTSEPTREEQRQELARLLEYSGIARSANLVRLLTFVCEKQFEGKPDELRESGIAIHALGRRPEDFDPQVDPIVRVTARTLRQRLADYYRSEGSTHEVELVLPTGQYVPHFVRRKAAARPVPEADGRWRLGGRPRRARAPLARRRRPAPPARGAVARTRRVGGRWVSRLRWCRVRPRLLGRPRDPTPGLPPRRPRRVPVACGGAPSGATSSTGRRARSPTRPRGRTTSAAAAGATARRRCTAILAPPGPHPAAAAKPNAYLDGDGNLVIEARRHGGTWTSARLKTMGLREFEYGRIEARMKLPVGAGLWPAFWLLGADIEKVGWPHSGSITVTENVPDRPDTNGLGPTAVRSTLHGPGYFGGNGLWQNFTLPAGRPDRRRGLPRLRCDLVARDGAVLRRRPEQRVLRRHRQPTAHGRPLGLRSPVLPGAESGRRRAVAGTARAPRRPIRRASSSTTSATTSRPVSTVRGWRRPASG